MSEKIEAPEPGIYSGVDFGDYCRWDAVNNSSLGPLLKSPAHYEHAQQNPRKETSALSFGRLCHAGRLEPLLLMAHYIVMPDLTEGIESKRPTSTNEYKQRVEKWKEQNSDKEIVTRADYDALIGTVSALADSETAVEWFNGPGPVELSMVWKDRETGLTCKGRVDKVNESLRMLCDLKTTRDCGVFRRSIVDYGYDRQAAFYLDGWRAVTGSHFDFGICAVESSAPFGVMAAPLSPVAVAAGREKYRRALRLLAESRECGVFRGYESPERWELPRWESLDSVTLFRDGEPFTVCADG